MFAVHERFRGRCWVAGDAGVSGIVREKRNTAAYEGSACLGQLNPAIVTAGSG